MTKLQALRATTINTRIVFWPCLVDMLTSVLMIFLLIYFIQATLGRRDPEAEAIRNSQEKFVAFFHDEFAREMKDKAVEISSDLNLVQIRFSDRILFDPGAYQLKPIGQTVLRRCAVIFGRSGPSGFRQIQVEGHTDDRPISNNYSYPRDNWELSAGRAISVVKFLIAGGIKEELLSANGYAANKPVDTGHSEAALARNRRIEIRIIFSTPDQRQQQQSQQR
jgi:flagellar motor protein MotB